MAFDHGPGWSGATPHAALVGYGRAMGGRTLLLAGLVVAALASGCGGFSESGVREVWVGESRSFLQFEVGNCTADTRIDEVVEGPDAVVVSLSEKTKNNDDCGGRLVTVELEEPLGDRSVVNGHTGVVLGQTGPGAAAGEPSD